MIDVSNLTAIEYTLQFSLMMHALSCNVAKAVVRQRFSCPPLWGITTSLLVQALLKRLTISIPSQHKKDKVYNWKYFAVLYKDKRKPIIDLIHNFIRQAFNRLG